MPLLSRPVLLAPPLLLRVIAGVAFYGAAPGVLAVVSRGGGGGGGFVVAVVIVNAGDRLPSIGRGGRDDGNSRN